MPDYEMICDYVKMQEIRKASKINICGLMRGYATMIKVLFICHGNICRSTLAQSFFTPMVLQTSLSLTVVQQAEKKSAIHPTEELSIN